MSKRSHFLSLNFLLGAIACLTGFCATAQIYYHDFGNTTIASHPYTAAPAMSDAHLSNSSWSNSTGVWTSASGASGEAIRLTTATAATINLTFDVANNFQAEITSFSLWSQRSAAGPQNWSLSVNGTAVGSGTTATAGSNSGIIPVSVPVNGLTGTVQVTLSISGSTGNGTYRLDDFTLNGSVTSNCSGSIITAMTPVSGPQNTLVTISGSGFQSGSGTSQVLFNGVPSVFEVVSDTEIKAFVPAGNASGPVSVTTNGCEAFSPTSFTELVSSVQQNYSSDIYFSEIYDAQAGDGGVIELYNGTAATVNLSGYSIKRYGDIGGTTFYTINLVGSIPPAGIFLVGIGTGIVPCNITGNQHYSTGFNSNDDFQLFKNGVWIDDVHAPQNVGYSVIRKPNVVAPNPVFNPNDWDTYTTEGCADIGQHDVVQNQPPTVTGPLSVTTCENGQAIFSVSLPQAGFSYQWKMLDGSGNWVNVPNAAPFSGGQTNTLTLSPVPSGFDAGQYYCEMVSASATAVSNAAQLTVSQGLAPDFATTLTICSGDSAPALASVSPNGISGSWNPATIDNTQNGVYTFTPDPGQCASAATLSVAVTPQLVPDFSASLSICSGDSAPALASVSPNGISGSWNPATIDNTQNGVYTFTPNPGQCASTATLSVAVTPQVVPDFATSLTICNGDSAPVLASVSPNGISGSWNPAAISNTQNGNYTFTPDPGQCASAATLSVAVTPQLVPDFSTSLSICSGDSAPALASVSPNGISGSWNPATIDNTQNGVYTFTPDPGQCASSATLSVTVTPQLVPDFATSLSICSGDSAPVLASVSPNGISGSWNPATIDNTQNGVYTFTPDPGQCASMATLSVMVTPQVVPDFATSLSICSGDSAPALASVSPNGISGSWNPATIDNTQNGVYTFTPDPGQCASMATLSVTVTPQLVPDFATSLSICSGDSAPALASVSPNGISGSWNPVTISNTQNGIYTFTPNSGQCASTATLSVMVTPQVVPDFATALSICSGDSAPALASVSPNGISGSWNPATIDNTQNGVYTFTPDPGQCASMATLSVMVTPQVVPDFSTSLSICSGDSAPALASVSPNGISGSWNPAAIDNTQNGIYTFTPNSGQCASAATLSVTVTPQIAPDFSTSLSICSGDSAPALASVSPNGISGSWNPVTIDNTQNGVYTFTPNSGQCASTATLSVAVTPQVVPDFATSLSICSGDSAPALASVSPNGISGSWNPATISNTQNGVYTFTPNPGQCATAATLSVTVQSPIIPVTAFAYNSPVCANSAAVFPQTPAGFTAGGLFTSGPGLVIDAVTGEIDVQASTAGNHTITYTVLANAATCSQGDSHNFTLTIDPSTPVSIAGPAYVCEAGIVQFSASAAGSWSSSDTSVATVDNLGEVTGISPGTATIVFTPAGAGCQSQATANLVVQALPAPDLDDAFICVDPQTGALLSAAVLDTGLAQAGLAFAWTHNGQPLAASGPRLNATEPGQYEVVVVNTVTGCSASAQAQVGISSMAVASAVVATDFSDNQTITVNVTGGSGNYLFQLDNGLPQSGNQFFNIEEGEYTITVRDQNGCSSLELVVHALNYPHFFTPNADGYHDYWNIKGLAGNPQSLIYIFDRYGKLIKSLKPSQNSGWDGTYNGKALPSSDYWFTVTYEDNSQKQSIFKAHFSLKR